MVKFINIETGRVYDGSKPYIHWFDDQQSIDLIYVHRLCVLSDTASMNVKMTANDIFSLLDDSKIASLQTEKFDNIDYYDLQKLKVNQLTLTGVPYGTYYVYMIYVMASSSNAQEYVQDIYINGEMFSVGTDFYNGREELKTSLANMGVEIPESIQKAIYPSNVHEEALDNILLNRKYKELIMDYMNILGTKGNYMSILNSIDWFEYGDLLRAREFWKHDVGSRIIYEDRDFLQMLTKKTENLLVNYTKTTYMGIYCAMQCTKNSTSAEREDAIEYDKETYPIYVVLDSIYNAETDRTIEENGEQDGAKDLQMQMALGASTVEDYIHSMDPDAKGSNWKSASLLYKDKDRFLGEGVPALLQASLLWTRTDISIKMALLKQFFATYFMPIHMDLIHCTIEDLVYTNAIKVLPGGTITRTDYVINNFPIKCNIKDGEVFALENAEVQVSEYKEKNDDFSLTYTTPLGIPFNYSHVTIPVDGSSATGITAPIDDDYNSHLLFGVSNTITYLHPDDLEATAKTYEHDLKTFMTSNYNGVGKVIPVELQIQLEPGDNIVREQISMVNDKTEQWECIWLNQIYTPDKDTGIVTIKFDLLVTKDKDYDIRMIFYNTNSQMYSKNLIFSTVDTRAIDIKVWKLMPNPNWDMSSATGLTYNNFVFRHTPRPTGDPTSDDYYTQYLPISGSKVRGIHLNRLVTLRGTIEKKDGTTMPTLNYLVNECGLSFITSNFEVYHKYNLSWKDLDEWGMPITDPYKKHIDPSSIGGNNPTYLTLVSKDFVNDLIEKRVDKILDKMYIAKLADSNSKRVFKNGTIFIPQKHHLELIDTDRFYTDINSVEHKPSLQDYMIEQDDLACVIPDIKYLNKIKQFEWEFINKTTGEVVHLPSIKEPMVASQLKNGLKPGYYSVKFRYKLSTYSNEVHEVMRDCAFIIKK